MWKWIKLNIPEEEQKEFFQIEFKDTPDKDSKETIDISDFELAFVRNETANVQSKAQAFQTLMSAGLHPELAAAKSGNGSSTVSTPVWIRSTKLTLFPKAAAPR